MHSYVRGHAKDGLRLGSNKQVTFQNVSVIAKWWMEDLFSSTLDNETASSGKPQKGIAIVGDRRRKYYSTRRGNFLAALNL